MRQAKQRTLEPGKAAGRLACALVIALVFALGTSAAPAQQDVQDLERPPDIPPIDAQEQPLPPKVQEEQIEPTVTIREEEDRRVEEYSYGGRIYMVKIIPAVGPPYYYVDTDGDGSLETAPDKGIAPVSPAQWKIKEWD